MKKIILLLFFCLLLTGCIQKITSLPGLNKNQTANQALAVAKKEALKYAGDAYLVDGYSLTSTSGKTYADGTSQTWYFKFISPSKNEKFRLDVEQGKVTEIKNNDGTATIGTKLPDQFADSDQVAKAVKPHCTATEEGKYFYNLTDDKWSVKCVNAEKGEISINVDFNGQFLKIRD
ncbi:MAG: hypothetical protein V1810_00480 [Candidatus Beckwithbacteria bacterium]